MGRTILRESEVYSAAWLEKESESADVSANERVANMRSIAARFNEKLMKPLPVMMFVCKSRSWQRQSNSSDDSALLQVLY